MDKKKTIIDRIIDYCETLSLEGLKWNFAGILSLLLFLSMLFQENNSSIRRCKWMFIPIILYWLFKRPSLTTKKTVNRLVHRSLVYYIPLFADYRFRNRLCHMRE